MSAQEWGVLFVGRVDGPRILRRLTGQDAASRKKNSARIQSSIAFPGFSWTFSRLVQIFSRIYPEKSEKIGKTVGKGRKNCRKRSEKVGKGRKRSKNVGKGRKRSDFSFGQKYCQQSWNPQYFAK